MSLRVRDELNRLNPNIATILPMDGFHYYKRALDVMSDPALAYARRGAHWTFNAASFVQCVRRVREQDEVLVPSFDHAVGDPIEEDIVISKSHRIVLVEG